MREACLSSVSCLGPPLRWILSRVSFDSHLHRLWDGKVLSVRSVLSYGLGRYLQAIERRERLRRLALETIDLSKDPYFMRNHLGQYECRLCLTLHNNEGNYLAHTQVIQKTLCQPHANLCPPWICMSNRQRQQFETHQHMLSCPACPPQLPGHGIMHAG